MASIPNWQLDGDWFDVCKCNIPCPCEFAQTPTFGDCDGILVWHVRKGAYGDIALDGLNVLALGFFEGNLWAGAKATEQSTMKKGNNRLRVVKKALPGLKTGII